MTLESWDPDKRLQQFRAHSNRLWDEFLSRMPSSIEREEPLAFAPEVDLVESQKEYRIYVSIPGLLEDDIQIEVEGRHLTIRGVRQPPYDVEHRNPQVLEWRYGFFERHFELKHDIDLNSLRIAYDAGVLTIVAQKQN